MAFFLIFKIFNINIFNFRVVILIILRIYGGVIASIICIRQTDIKAFVAYSSVAHISLIVVGIFINTLWGIIRAKIIIFAHGFTSPALFYLAYLTYIKSSRRRLIYSGGVLVLYPSLRLIWFLLLRVNIAAPPTINLVGELLIIPVLFIGGICLICIIIVLILFRAVYNIYLYSMVNHGGYNKLILPAQKILCSNYLGVLLHLFPLILIVKKCLFN